MEELPLRPLFDRVLLQREKLTHSGSILIPEEAAKRHAPNRGTIVAIGPNVEPGLEVGCAYIFGAYAGTWINAKGSPLLQGDNVADAEFYVCQDTDLIAEVMTDG